MSDGSVCTLGYEWHLGRWVATSGLIVNRRDGVWSNFAGILYRHTIQLLSYAEAETLKFRAR